MAASTKDTRGWVYSGLSIRLAIDLGLHIDMKPYVEKGQMDAAEAKVRKTTFWGAFIVDKLWGFYLGRPPMHIETDTMSVEKPDTACETDPVSKWAPYGLPQSMQADLLGLANSVHLEEFVSYQLVLLYEIMSDVSNTLYSSVKITNKNLQKITFKTTADLNKWYADLPQILQMNLEDEDRGKQYLPHVLMLHMQYSKFQIYIHRPYISKHGIQPYPPVGPGHIHARNTAIEHAVRISRLLCKYKSLYSLQYINIEAISITFSAALILVFATVSEFDGPTDADLRLHLSQCCKALAELGKTFQSSTRTLDVLLSIKRVWQAKLLASAGSKRANSTMRSTSDKRPRLISTEQTSS